MTAFGVTPTGFVPRTEDDIVADMQRDQLAGISQQLDVSEDSVVGRLNRIYAKRAAEAWQALADSYNGFDPDKAAAVLLTNLSKLTGTPRAGATQSTVFCHVVAAPGTVLQSGVHFASVVGSPDVKFTPQVDFTAATTDTFDVLWVSEKTGPIAAPDGQLTVIATPVVGWTSIDNTGHDAALGSPVETDPQLRLSRQRELTRSGSATVDAIAAKLVALFEGIEGATVASFNNPNDHIDANGLPPHSFEMVVWDPSSAITNDQIAQTIWDNKPAGVPSFGATSGHAIDKKGATQVVAFTRATPIPIYVSYIVTPKLGYVGDSAFAQAVALNCSEGIIADSNGVLASVLDPFTTGVDVTLYDLTVATQGLGAQVLAVTFGTAPSPGLSANIVIGTRQIAAFDSGRISVTS